MATRGMIDRRGETFGYVEGSRVYDRAGNLIGAVRENAIYDLDDNRQFRIDGDALLDARWRVVGYLGEPARPDQDSDFWR